MVWPLLRFLFSCGLIRQEQARANVAHHSQSVRLTPFGKLHAGAGGMDVVILHDRRVSSCAHTNVVTRQGAEASKLNVMPKTPGWDVGCRARVCFFRLTWFRIVAVVVVSAVGTGARGGWPY